MIENLYETNKIRTFTGIYIDPLNPEPDQIHIEDIAHALSHICRFNGHTKEFYSVANHSIWVAAHCPEELRLQALLHDASEAYLCDIPKPFKHRLTNYCEIEENLMHVIASRFGFKWPVSPRVKEYDELALEWEWGNLVICKRTLFSEINPNQTKQHFLKLYNRYKEEVKV